MQLRILSFQLNDAMQINLHISFLLKCANRFSAACFSGGWNWLPGAWYMAGATTWMQKISFNFLRSWYNFWQHWREIHYSFLNYQSRLMEMHLMNVLEQWHFFSTDSWGMIGKKERQRFKGLFRDGFRNLIPSHIRLFRHASMWMLLTVDGNRVVVLVVCAGPI